MKAILSMIDPCGSVVKSKKFYLPFIKKNIIQTITLKDGTKVKGEPMRQNRYILEVGDYKYFVSMTGKITKLN